MTKKAKKMKPDAMVTLAALCGELGIDAYDARRKLRAADLAHKRGAAWEWEPDSPELAAARNVLTQHDQ